jgi:hypothetical protein
MSWTNTKPRRSFDFTAPYTEEGERLVTIPFPAAVRRDAVAGAVKHEAGSVLATVPPASAAAIPADASALGGIELLKMFFNWKTNRQRESLGLMDARTDLTARQMNIMQERINYLDGVVKERSAKPDQVCRDLRESEEKRMTPDTIIIHCPAARGTQNATVEQTGGMHRARGFLRPIQVGKPRHIGYHYYVRRGGTVFPGRLETV